MKRLIYLTMLLIFSFGNAMGNNAIINDVTKTRIPIDHTTHDALKDHGRSADHFIDAYLYSDTGVVEVNIFDMGITEVYIIDSSNQLVDYTSINTDIVPTSYLSTRGSGYYSIVIMSDTCYAEGHFMIP